MPSLKSHPCEADAGEGPTQHVPQHCGEAGRGGEEGVELRVIPVGHLQGNCVKFGTKYFIKIFFSNYFVQIY